MTADSPALRALEAARIVPVIVIDDAGIAPDLIDALIAGGIRAAEITLRTEAGLPALSAVGARSGFCLGAGTVLTPSEVDLCVDAGATFIVSPGFDEAVVARAQERGVLALPGTATATEIQMAVRSGLSAVKFFPADRLGGLATIATLAAPFGRVQFMPSGGVNLQNAADYLAHPAVFAISGSWMVPRSAMAARDFDEIVRLSTRCSADLSIPPARPGLLQSTERPAGS